MANYDFLKDYETFFNAQTKRRAEIAQRLCNKWLSNRPECAHNYVWETKELAELSVEDFIRSIRHTKGNYNNFIAEAYSMLEVMHEEDYESREWGMYYSTMKSIAETYIEFVVGECENETWGMQ